MCSRTGAKMRLVEPSSQLTTPRGTPAARERLRPPSSKPWLDQMILPVWASTACVYRPWPDTYMTPSITIGVHSIMPIAREPAGSVSSSQATSSEATLEELI